MKNIKTELKEEIELIFETYEQDFDLDSITRDFLNLFKREKKEILDKLNPDLVYPKDVFPEITEEELEKIDTFIESHFNFSRHNLTAHIGRRLLENLRKEIIGEWKQGKM